LFGGKSRPVFAGRRFRNPAGAITARYDGRAEKCILHR
jgi:hypothetical protein